MSRLSLRTCAVVVLLVSVLPLSSCSLDAVAKFASQSGQALAKGPGILKDIEASCIRGEVSKANSPYYGLAQADQAAQVQADAAKACEVYTDETPSMLVASKTLTDYFTAISQLATTGKTSTGKNTESDKAAQSAAKTPKSITLMQSVGKIIDLIGKMAAEGYRTEHLQKDLNSVSPDVENVLTALEEFGSVDYNTVLTVEQQEYERQLHDLELLPTNDSSTKIIRVLAKDDESNTARLIAAKHATATAYGDAIKQIIAGHAALLKHPGKLNAKDVPTLIQPYTDSLSQIVQKLIPLF